MGEILSLPFMQRALLGGILVGILASYYGVFIVQRGLSFLGSGLAHAAFGGVALGLLLGAEPLWVAAIFTIVVALGIAWVRLRTNLGGDTTIGIFFAVSMALGIVFLFMRKEYTNDAFAYLFGSILSVTERDLWMTAIVCVLSLFSWPLWKRWSYATFDRELAQSDRLPVVRDDYYLSILIAITVVAAIKVVGIVLIAAFLVIPAATARLMSPTFRLMTILSVLTGVVSAVCGLFLSYYLDVPSGATIILLQAALFVSAMILKTLFRHKA
ncbi:manganese transporter [candidate division KSB1 bacterium RBG_16_48_16]|nr:MAG: manganese transporter [candidate division KSB1 bacterium RBG_16_48_16]